MWSYEPQGVAGLPYEPPPKARRVC